jgi:hypothetical protein
VFALVTAALVAAGLAAGGAAVSAVQSRADLVGGVAATNGPLAVAAQDLYHVLSDADATVASAFLQGGSEPPELRQRYQDDLAGASAALVRLAGGVTDGPGAAAVAQLSAHLPVYAGLVETARALNRQGLPIGSAYLREASGLMRQTLLPAAQQLYRAVADRLAEARDAAAAVPWLAVPLGLLLFAGLVAAQVHLLRRTNRIFNVGLVVASSAGLAILLWLGVAWTGAAGHLGDSRRHGSAQVDLLAEARIAALQARGDESLTLVARGAGAAFETRFAATMVRLAGEDGSGGLLADARARATDDAGRAAVDAAIADVRIWREVHRQIRELDDSGRYAEAVRLAIGSETGSAGGVSGRVDAHLAEGIRHGSARFDREVARAGRALGGVGTGLAALTVVLVLGVAVGMSLRVMEYR